MYIEYQYTASYWTCAEEGGWELVDVIKKEDTHEMVCNHCNETTWISLETT